MATKKTEITTSFTADISGLKKGIKDAKQQITIANAEFKKATAGMDDWKKSSEGVAAKLKQLGSTLEQQKSILSSYQKQLALTEEAYGENSEEANKLRVQILNQEAAIAKTEKQIGQYEKSLEELKFAESEAGKDAEKLAKQTEDAKKAAKDGAEGFSALKLVLAELAADAIKKVIEGLVNLGKEVINTGKEFSASMSEVKAISGATAEEMETLEATARKFGETTTFSASEAAQALKYMALAGWDANTSAKALGGVLNLAAASGMGLAEASDMVTDYLTAFGMSAEQSTYFADMLAYAQSHANTTAEQLGEAYKNSAATLHASGQDVETVTSLLSSMANQGLKGSEAGTALSAVMRDMTSKMSDGAIAIGDTTVKVQDQAGNFRDLTDILTDVQEATEGMGDAEKMVALQSTFTARSLKGISLLLNTSVKSTAAFEEELRKCTGTAEDMSDVMTDNLEGDLTKFNSKLQEAEITIYKGVEPSLRDMVASLGNLIDKGVELAQKVLPPIINAATSLAKNFELVVDIIGALALGFAVFKTAAIAIGVANAAMILYTNSAARAAVAQELLNLVTSVNPWVLLATAVAVAMAALTAYYKSLDKTIDRTEALNDEQKKVYESANELNNSLQETAKARKEEIKSIDAEKKITSKLLDELRSYVDENGNVIESNDRVKDIVGELNTLMPELNLAYDEQAQAISMTTDEIEKNIDAMVRKAKAAAAEQQMTEIMKERIATEIELTKMEDTLLAAQERVNTEKQKYREIQDRINEAIENNDKKALKELNKELEEQNTKWHEAIDALHPIAMEYGHLEDNIESLSEEEQVLTDMLGESSDAMGQNGQAVGTLVAETDEAVEAMEDKWQSLHDAVAESIGKQMNLFDEYTAAEAKSKDEILKNMTDQVTAMESWSDNLQLLAKRGIDEGLLESLAKMGTDGAGYVQAFVDMSADELQQANKLFQEATTIPETTAGQVTENYKNLGQYRAQLYAKGLVQEAGKQKSVIEDSAKQTGKYTSEGLIKGVEESQPEVNAAFGKVSTEALDTLNKKMGVQSPSRMTMQTGRYINEGLMIGLKNTTPQLLQTVTSICLSILQKFTTELSKDKFVKIGEGVGRAIAEGIRNGAANAKGELEAVAKSIAETIQGVLDENMKKDEYYKIGKMVGEAVAEGMNASLPAVKAAAGKIAAAAKVSTGGNTTKAGAPLDKTISSITSSIGNMGALANTVSGRDNIITTNNSETVNNYNFVQNNTSPKALSRLDIYRDTRNLLRGI